MGKRNPNGYGCVTKLKGNRSRPWCVKVTIYDEEGHAKQVPVGYAETEEKANILLAEYNNNPWNIDREKVTLAILYQRWCKLKLPKLGESNQFHCVLLLSIARNTMVLNIVLSVLIKCRTALIIVDAVMQHRLQ